MTKSRKKLVSLVVAAMYAMSVFVAAPVQAFAATTGTHVTVAYTAKQKAAAKKAAEKALAKLPADQAAAEAFATSAELQTLVKAADKAIATAKKMKLSYKNFKNYKRLAVSKAAVTVLVAAEKDAAEKAAAEKAAADTAAAKKVSDLIAALPATITMADEAKVTEARTAYTALTADQMKLVLNLATLTAAETKIADMKKVAVKEVKAASAKTITVEFTSAPADTAKVVFTVQRNTTPVSVTATWNTEKTVATLAGVFPEGEYNVSVKNDTVDLGAKKVTFTQQKVSKIEITSTKLAVSGVYNVDQKGYASYKVLDQYGTEITTTSLGTSVNFSSGVASAIEKKNGVLIITPFANTNLVTFANVVITGYDSSTGVTATATLTTSTVAGTLSEITLSNELTNTEKKVLTAGDTTSTWYIPYKALDLSGNETKDFNLVKNGLIYAVAASRSLNVSSNYVTATIEDDNGSAVIRVKVLTGTVPMDMPVNITAMTSAGKSSTITVTLKKAAAVSKFTLMAPAYDVASAEAKEIPFVAYDQNNVQMKKYEDLKNVTFTPNADANKDQIPDAGATGLYLVKNIDGTAKLMLKAITTTTTVMPMMLTAMTSDGNISNLTVNVQKPVLGDTLTLDDSVLIPTMQMSAEQGIDFGWTYGGFAVKDQYGRAIDMMDASTAKYRIVATSNTPGVITVNDAAAGTLLAGTGSMTLKAVALGNAKVTFALQENVSGVWTEKNTKEAYLTVIADSEITDYTLDTVDTLYTGTASGTGAYTAANDQELGYKANPCVYGKTNSGTKVVINGTTTKVTGAYVDNSDFLANFDSTSAYVVAKKFTDAAKTGATGTLTVTILAADKTVQSRTAALKSTTVAPVASTLKLSVNTGVAGITRDGDNVYVDLTNAGALGAFATGKLILRVDNASGSAAAGRAPAYVYAADQYASKTLPVAQITKIAGLENGVSNFGFNVSATGVITVNPTGIGNGQIADVTVVTTNGLVKTVRFVFTTAYTAAQAATATATASTTDVSALVAAYEALPITTDAEILASKTDTKVTAAQTAVSALAAGTEKTALQNRIDAKKAAVTATQAAYDALIAYEALPLSSDVQIAAAVTAQTNNTAVADGTVNKLLTVVTVNAAWKANTSGGATPSAAARVTAKDTAITATNAAKTTVLAFEGLALDSTANIATAVTAAAAPAGANSYGAANTALNAANVDTGYKAAGLTRIASKKIAVYVALIEDYNVINNAGALVLTDLTNAGATNCTAANLATYKTTIAAATAGDANTTVKIQALVDAANATANTAALTAAQTACATAVTTTTAANIALAETALKAAIAADTTDASADNTAAIATAKASVVNDSGFTFVATRGADNTHIVVTLAGTDINDISSGYTVTIKDAVTLATSTKVVATAAANMTATAITAFADGAVDNNIVTYTNDFWGKTDTVSVATTALDAAVVAAD